MARRNHELDQTTTKLPAVAAEAEDSNWESGV